MRQLVAALALAAFAFGCDSGGSDTSGVGDLVVSVSNVGFLVQTAEEYPCSNLHLDLESNVVPGRMDLSVVGLAAVPKGICTTAFGPATAAVSFPERFDPRNVEVRITKDGQTDRLEHTCGFGGCQLSVVGTPVFTSVGPRR